MLTVLRGSNVTTIATAEFDDLAACTAASKAILAEFSPHAAVAIAPRAMCVPKASK